MNESKSKCAVCGKAQDARLRPFCSKRCADLDLHRWFTGAYAIPVEEGQTESPGEETQN